MYVSTPACLCGVVVACGTRNPAICGSLLAKAFTTHQIRTVKMCKLTVVVTSGWLVH